MQNSILASKSESEKTTHITNQIFLPLDWESGGKEVENVDINSIHPSNFPCLLKPKTISNSFNPSNTDISISESNN